MTQLSRRCPPRRLIPFTALLWAGLFAAGPGWGALLPVSVGNYQELSDAIETANNDSNNTYTITVSNSITLAGALPNITATALTITSASEEPAGRPTIDGVQAYPIFFVESQDDVVTVSNLRIVNGYVRGGDGADGGGGGLGAGAGLFVDSGAAVVVRNVQFAGNVARGGDGGSYGSDAAGGGGGGLIGDGGANGGGGGGFCSDGASGDDGGDGGGLCAEGDDSGGSGNLGSETDPGGTGGDGSRFGGGGGGLTGGGDGGTFGGGGGAVSGEAGAGGWGGGGGGGPTPGSGGFGGGDGAASGRGNGGSAFGGAVFVRQGGTLTIADSDFPDSSTPNGVQAGQGTENGGTAGGAIYLDESVNLEYYVDEDGEAVEVHQSIGGDGSLTKTGGGTLDLREPNTYAGNTTVEAGELRGTMPALQNESADKTFAVQGGATEESKAVLTLVHASGSAEFEPEITGGGKLRKEGGGTVTLTNNQNDYLGGTEVVEGTLAGTTQTIPAEGGVSIGSGGRLRLDESGSSEFSGILDGYAEEAAAPTYGTFEKAGSGTLWLTGDSSDSWDGTTQVTAGTLGLKDGGALGGTVEINRGARLAGVGNAGDTLTVRGTVAPGLDSFGALTVDEDASFEPNSVLEVRVGAGGPTQTDTVAVTGNANIDGDALLSVRPADGDYVGVPLEVLTATSVSGNFTLLQDFCGLTEVLSLSPDATAVQLTLTNSAGSPFGQCAETPNQQAVAGALDAIPPEQAPEDIYRTARRLTAPEIQLALDSMSGEASAAFSNARLANGARLMSTLSQRLRDSGAAAPENELARLLGGGAGPSGTGIHSFASLALPIAGFGASQLHSVDVARRPEQPPFTFVSMRGGAGLGAWLDGYALFGDVEGDSNSGDTEFSLYGTAAGVDYRLAENLLLGISAAWSRTNLSASSLRSWGHSYTYQGALYGALTTDHFYLGVIGEYGRSRFSTRRYISFGSFYERPKAKFSGYEISGYAELGLAAFDLPGVQLQPVASFFYAHLQQDGFTESRGDELDPGDASLRLAVDGQKIDSMVGSAGLRLYQIFEMKEGYQIIPELRARYAYEFGDTEREVEADFADLPSSPFTVKGAEAGRHTAQIGLGWTVVIDELSSMYFNYDADIARDLFAHSFAVGYLVRW